MFETINGRAFPWWIPLGAILIAVVYLPTLGTRFDFIDDGNLVYPSGPMPVAERADLVWQKIKANYDDLGPFRPVLWVHWEIQAELFGADAFVWRCSRWCWTVLAATMFLWLLRELKLAPWAALLTTAGAMWNPFRNEIWTSLTLAEGVAMPYALLGLVAAVRAARGERPVRRWLWDFTVLFGTLMALGCKNVFVVLVPVQMFLRFFPDGLRLREGWQTHGWRPLVLALPIVPFVAHYIYFEAHWHPGQYRPAGPSWAQFARYLNGLKGASSLDYLGLGLLLCLAALGMRRMFGAVWRTHATVIVAGALLTVGGIAMYLPMDGLAGRYTMPAVWGFDLLIAVGLTGVLAIPSLLWKRVVLGVVACGLCGVATANVGRQIQFAARAEMLWQALEWVECRPLPAGTSVAWIGARTEGKERGPMAPTPLLSAEEGVHFSWHMQARRGANFPVCVCDDQGKVVDRYTAPGSSAATPEVLVTAADSCPTGIEGNWERQRTFETVYCLGWKRYCCSVWLRRETTPPATAFK